MCLHHVPLSWERGSLARFLTATSAIVVPLVRSSLFLGARASGSLPDGNECHRGATGALIYAWERGPLARFLTATSAIVVPLVRSSMPGSAGLWPAS